MVPGFTAAPDAQAENSEVLWLGFVAVAVKTAPVMEAVGMVKVKPALPFASVANLCSDKELSPKARR
jgi:hypothetical protein